MTENDILDTCASPSSSLGQWEETFGFNEEKELAIPLSPKITYISRKNDRECPYSPFNWVCKGYDSLEDYRYFDGTPGSSDQRFLIDLDTDSMEGLYDVRPYLYAMGYWHDAMTNPVRAYTCLAEQGDEAIEAAYVRAGRESLRIERANGRGYFMPDEDWAQYNKGPLATMPFYEGVGKDGPGYVGVDKVHQDDRCVMVRGHIKTNIRTPLPDKEVMIHKVGGGSWDMLVQWLYFNDLHPIYGMVNYNRGVAETLYERAAEARSGDLVTKEALYLYPDPWGDHPVPMRPAEAKAYTQGVYED